MNVTLKQLDPIDWAQAVGVAKWFLKHPEEVSIQIKGKYGNTLWGKRTIAGNLEIVGKVLNEVNG